MGKSYKTIEETWTFEGFTEDEIKSLTLTSSPININFLGKNKAEDAEKQERVAAQVNADNNKAAEEAEKAKAAKEETAKKEAAEKQAKEQQEKAKKEKEAADKVKAEEEAAAKAKKDKEAAEAKQAKERADADAKAKAAKPALILPCPPPVPMMMMMGISGSIYYPMQPWGCPAMMPPTIPMTWLPCLPGQPVFVCNEEGLWQTPPPYHG